MLPLISTLAAALALGAPAPSPATEGTAGAAPPWVQIIGAEESLHQFTAVAFQHQGGALWVAEQWHRPESSELTPALWRIDASGLSAREVPRSSWDPERDLLQIESMAEGGDGRLAVLARKAAGGFALLRLGTQERPEERWDLEGGPPGVELHRVVPAAAGGFLLLGHGGPGGVVLGVSPQGEVSLLAEIPAEEQIYLADAVALADGGFFLLHNYGSFVAGFVGECRLRLGRYSERGELLAERDFEGRHGDALTLPEGGVVMLFDGETGAEAQAIRLKALGPELEELWETAVLETSGFLAPEWFELLPAGAASWLVAGARMNKPWLAAVDARGALTWQRWEEGQEIAPRYDAAVGPKTAFVVSSALGRRMKRIRVLGFELGTDG